MVYRWDFEEKRGQWLENLAIVKLCSSAYFLVNNWAKKTDLKGAWIILEETVTVYRDHNGDVHCLHKQFSTNQFVESFI